MRTSQYLLSTLKEDPKEAAVGTKYEDGKFYTNGGRVLGVTCNAYTLQAPCRFR